MAGIQSLLHIFKQIVQALQVHTLFPAATLTIATCLLAPQYAVLRQKLNSSDISLFLIVITILISNMFAAFNGLIIRFIEGYEHDKNKIVYFLTGWLFWFWRQRETKRYDNMKNDLDKCEKDCHELVRLRNYYEHKQFVENRPNVEKLSQIEDLLEKTTSKRNRLKIRFENRFAPSKILPTSFGNTLSAFEHYPMKRYQMDCTCLWPCLLPILERKKFTDFLHNEKSRVDFLLNSALAGLIIAFEAFLLFSFYKPAWEYLLLCAGLIFLACFLYVAAVFAATDWGTMVKAAFDLYRYELHQALHLRPLRDGDINDERSLWHSISEFLILGDAEAIDGFYYSKPIEEKEDLRV